MNIPFLDLYAINKEFSKAFFRDFIRVTTSGNLVLSSEVKNFEDNFAKYCGTKYCIGVGNGLQALEIVLKAWGVEQGDEIIVPSNTYIASILAILRNRFKPIFAIFISSPCQYIVI